MFKRWRIVKVVSIAGERKKLFSNIECHHFGSTDAGLVVIEGKLVEGRKDGRCRKRRGRRTGKMRTALVSENELQKVKNKTESMITFEDMSVMSRANSLAYYETQAMLPGWMKNWTGMLL
ncbi:MAG: hypothetical protein IPH18_18200 [Chitinophagaceae bacterium]|nr:hypothetical protein [Chitinophagaceae bacterium]